MASRNGFSLIELLIVVAIIALLAGLVLVGVGTVRAQAKRSSCAGNLRQTAMAMTQFATDRDGMVPLLYDSVRQGSYLIWDLAVRPRGWGLLFDGDFVDDPRLFYCPAATTATNMRYNATGNAWRNNGTLTRSSYSIRPVQFVATGASAPTNLPLLRDYQARALAADACSQGNQPLTMHVNGINTVYGDGHVRWQPTIGLDASWRAIPLNASWSSAYDNAGVALWNGLDDLR